MHGNHPLPRKPPPTSPANEGSVSLGGKPEDISPGVKALLASISEKAEGTECGFQTALDNLPNKSDILLKAQEMSPSANAFVREIKSYLNFVDHRKYMTQISNRYEGWNKGVSGLNSMSLAIVPVVIPHLKAARSADSVRPTILLSFLADHDIPIDLLYRGSSRRKRWTEGGEIIETDPAELGLSEHLIRVCAHDRLTNTLSELQSLSAIVWTSNSTFQLRERERREIQERLSTSLRSFWCLQALILACRSVPWKYLEHMESDKSLLLSHIRYALEGARRWCKFEAMTRMVRVDIALSLMEFSRFSVMEWKQFAVNQAKELTIGLDDSDLRSQLAQRQCLLHRLSGETDLAFTALMDGFPHQINRRSHAIYGHTILQRALNHIQLDRLDKAMASLAEWQPVSQPHSAMEQVVLFRQYLLMSKILRYQGHFTASLQHLQRPQNITITAKDLVFVEDASDLACNLADTYLELDESAVAESCLRAAIKHQASKQAAVMIVLAECLFAQQRFTEVDEILRRISECQLKLMKMDKLRQSIVQAKLSHIRTQFEEAFRHWTEAMSNLGRFTLASGRTTRIILLSQCHVLHRQGLFDIENRTRDQLDALERCSGMSGASYWISGLRHWLHFLESCRQL
ncbi:hypothetical protein BO71DRAFT_327280 [Aspergillus ellipticus CBS 707.79]|uniref:MalT-like TPR region domain-containing protein n=1 Tax=Aspergillus ellipticus CBS 707.79 TaxID=1448320 RepID=A0A319DHM5_9EURO|nr:hypothetical protein BO71DRAFT_327280 [Aspergillus ellipticus CBS 707.79]